jgi:Glycosyl hydrolases family 2, sugar binding domain
VIFRKPAVGGGNVAAEFPSSGGDKITVLTARYGALETPEKTRDVAAKVQELVDRGNMSFLVSDMAKDGDPAFGTVKTLEVTYSAGGKNLTASGLDSEFITIEPFQSNEGEITGPWEVSFDPKWGGPGKVVFEKLEDWSKHPEAGIKHYSGTATYRKTFPCQVPDSKSKIQLDLGKVAVMARVKFNGRDLGILWKPPYRVDITPFVKAGDNELEIQVVNLWPNRMIGDDLLPEDSERNPDGATLKQWPQWLLDGRSSPTGRFTFSTWRLWSKQDKLIASGLIGPVTLRRTSTPPAEK